jgi:hypothetical protein
MEVNGQSHASAYLPKGKDLVHILEEAGLAPGQIWTGAENFAPHPAGFDLLTVQPVASSYTDWAIPAHSTNHNKKIFHVLKNMMSLHSINLISIWVSCLHITIN